MAVNVKDYVCLMPFSYVAPFQDRIDACCSDWCDVSIPYKKGITTLEYCWNSKAFRELREDILQGNYSHCNSNCPFLSELRKTGNTLGMFVPKEKVEETPWLFSDPKLTHIKFCSDETCNLHCKACRQRVIVTKDSPLKYQFADLEESEIRKTVEIIDMLGSGEVFVSKPCLNWLSNFDASRYPKLKELHIHTNGLLFDSVKLGGTIPYIKSIEISIDAATKETYEKVRRGGNWEKLQTKVTEMIKTLTECDVFTISFVIQKWNVHEITDFYYYWSEFILSLRPGASIYFRYSPAEKWGIDDDDYEENVNIRNNKLELRTATLQINYLRSLKLDGIHIESSL